MINKAKHPLKTQRRISSIDRCLTALDHARLTLTDALPNVRPSPADSQALGDLTYDHTATDSQEKTASYLRVNHTGEVCAQALYLGQASQATSQDTRAHLLACAEEEQAHLQWCAQRLKQLNSKPSVFNPLWYTLSYALGASVAKLSDSISLGFIHATENQVKRHLSEHLEKIPESDKASRAILETMLSEEEQHAQEALTQGGKAFPQWIQSLMWASSRVMTALSSRL